MYDKEYIEKIISKVRKEFNIVDVTYTKYNGIYSFPNIILTDNDESQNIIQSYSDGKKIIFSSGRMNKILVSNVGLVNFTKKQIYGFYSILTINQYKEFLEHKDVVRVCKNIYNSITSDEIVAVFKNGKIAKGPLSTTVNKNQIDYEFYISFFFHYFRI